LLKSIPLSIPLRDIVSSARTPGSHHADYSKIASYYDKVRPVPAEMWSSKIIEYGRIEPGSAVLDVGCGTGRFTFGVSAVKETRTCGLDASFEMLEQALAKDESREILWIGGDGQRLPFRSGIFDCVYMTLVIHHIKNRRLAIREMYRALNKGGRCVIVTSSHARLKTHVLRDFPAVIAIDLKRFPTIPWIKGAMKRVGFQEVRHYNIPSKQNYVSTRDYLERVRNRYISTLTLLNEEEFQKGLKVFEERARKKYKNRIRQFSGFDFVVGRK
jgi:ubiquinone/menaquinone biosynthesis C-methylase UbiE